MTDARTFRGFRFPAEVILWAVRWYLQFSISYRDLERMLADRGVSVNHVTTIDFRLSARRDKQAARRFFRQALARENTRNPRVIVTDRLRSSSPADRQRNGTRERARQGD